MRVISLDTETFYSSKEGYGLKELGVSRYCRDERFDPYLLSVSDGTQSWAGPFASFNWGSLEGATILSHNQVFDQTVIREAQHRGLAPEFKFHEWLDTANLSAFLCNRRSLDMASEFLLGEKLSKATRNYADGKHWRDMVAEGKSEEMLEYARRDALTCHRIYSRFGHFWPSFERRLSDLTVRQSLRGVQIDVPKLQEYYKIVHLALQEMEASLPWVKEGKKVLSPKAVAEECRRCLIPSPPIKSRENGEEDFAIWYATYEKSHKWIRTFSDIRSIGILLDFLEKVRTRVDDEGALKFGLRYFGSHTGRWSGDAGINMLNLRKEKFFFGDDGLPRAEESEAKEIETCFSETGKYPAFVRHVVDVRSLFIARPGKRLIVSDFSQVEPRVAATLTGDTEMLEKMSTGLSPYQAYAESKLGWTGGDLKKADKKKYAYIKAAVLGLSYGTGWKKYIDVAKNMANVDVCESDPAEIQETNREGQLVFCEDGSPKMVSGYGVTAKRLVKEFREANPKLCGPEGLWRKLENAYRASIGGSFEMTMPSGRTMTYRGVKESWTRVYDEEEEKWRNKRVVTAELVQSGRIMRCPLWGSAIFENLCQSVARDLLGEAMLSLEAAPGVTVLWTVHDECVCETDPEVQAKDVTRLMEKKPEWFKECPLAAETAIVPHYTK